MRKNEIPKAKNNELLVDYIRSYSEWGENSILGRGVKQLERHCADLEKELVKRGILTEEDVKHLNS